MKPFKIGERAIALYTSRFPYQSCNKGEIYIVKAVSYCIKCGIQALNIGEVIPRYGYFVSECDCGACRDTEGLMWSDYRDFAHPEEISDITVEELIEESTDKKFNYE